MASMGEICDYIHNYFAKEKLRGVFKIENGQLVITPSTFTLLNGQYFRICGSVLNDGVYKYPDDTLQDEVFDGEVWAMAVPPAISQLAQEIETWEANNATILASPLQSESFGGYSYSKASGTTANGGSGQITWRDIFGKRLNAYRKLS